MWVTVKGYFGCPSFNCGMQYHEDDKIQVRPSPMGVTATHNCEFCDTKIELQLNDDDTVNL